MLICAEHIIWCLDQDIDNYGRQAHYMFLLKDHHVRRANTSPAAIICSFVTYGLGACGILCIVSVLRENQNRSVRSQDYLNHSIYIFHNHVLDHPYQIQSAVQTFSLLGLTSSPRPPSPAGRRGQAG